VVVRLEINSTTGQIREFLSDIHGDVLGGVILVA
jgi:hypothetical protein